MWYFLCNYVYDMVLISINTNRNPTASLETLHICMNAAVGKAGYVLADIISACPKLRCGGVSNRWSYFFIPQLCFWIGLYWDFSRIFREVQSFFEPKWRFILW